VVIAPALGNGKQHSHSIVRESAPFRPAIAMPTFGGLLKKKKTKESTSEDKNSGGAGYQPIQYKSSHKDTLSPVTSKTESNAQSQSTATTTVTSTPDPVNDKTSSNGAPQKTDMNVANLVNPAGGAVESKANARQTKGKYTLTDFTLQRTLGTGSFGRVHLVQSKHNQRYYAVKVLKKAQVVKMKQIEHTNDERKMLQRVKHPFLITLWGTFQDSKNLYMVMDFIEGGELFSLLRKSQVRTHPLTRSDLLTSTALSQPSRQVLRRRSDLSTRVPSCSEYNLSRLEA
jgi:protein kinase A